MAAGISTSDCSNKPDGYYPDPFSCVKYWVCLAGVGHHHQCPPDRMELGSRSWSLLHSVAAYFPSQPTLQQQEDARNFMHLFSR